MAALQVLLHATHTGARQMREFSFKESNKAAMPEVCRLLEIAHSQDLPSGEFWGHGAVLCAPSFSEASVEITAKQSVLAGSLLAAVPFVASAVGDTGRATQILTAPWHGASTDASALSAPITDAVQHCLSAAWTSVQSAAAAPLPDADTVFLAAAIVASWWCEVFLGGAKGCAPLRGDNQALRHRWGLADVACLLHHAGTTESLQPALFKRTGSAATLLHAALLNAARALVGAAGSAKWTRRLQRWHAKHNADDRLKHWPRAGQTHAETAMVPTEDQLQKLLCLVHANAHPVSDWAKAGRATGPGSQNNAGLAMAPGAALFNHSSHPNAAIVVLGEEGRVEVRACRDIAAGEAVRVAYVDVYRPPDARQKALMETFFFEESQKQYMMDLTAAYEQRPFGRELLVALHDGASEPPQQPLLPHGEQWHMSDPTVLAEALACRKCLVGAVVPCGASARQIPVSSFRRSIAGKLCSLLTLSSSSGSIKPRSGPNVTQTPPQPESPAAAPHGEDHAEFLPVQSFAAHAACEAPGRGDGSSIHDPAKPTARCVFCGEEQDCSNSARLHSAAQKVLNDATQRLQSGDAAGCLALLHSAEGQQPFVPLHFYNRSHLDRLLLANSAATALRDWAAALQSASRALHMLHAVCPAPSVQSAVLHGSQASALLMLWRERVKTSHASPPHKSDVRATLRLAIQEMDKTCGAQYPLYARLRRALDSMDS